MHRDALAAIIGARADSLSAPADLDGPTEWVGEQIGELLWGDISSWCGERSARTSTRIPRPWATERLVSALSQMAGFRVRSLIGG